MHGECAASRRLPRDNAESRVKQRHPRAVKLRILLSGCHVPRYSVRSESAKPCIKKRTRVTRDNSPGLSQSAFKLFENYPNQRASVCLDEQKFRDYQSEDLVEVVTLRVNGEVSL